MQASEEKKYWCITDGTIESSEQCHAKIVDACQNSTGTRIYLVRISQAAPVVVAWVDGEDGNKLLRNFAKWCALQVINLWEAPNIVRQYLKGTDGSLRDAARDAVDEAAEGTVGFAAWAAASAQHAAGSNVHDAVSDAAWTAAWSMASSDHVIVGNAAWTAAWNDARLVQEAKFLDMFDAVAVRA